MNSRYQQAVFAFSANREAQFPAAARVEIAFAGRSNAGKSSALNTLTNQKTLARGVAHAGADTAHQLFCPARCRVFFGRSAGLWLCRSAGTGARALAGPAWPLFVAREVLRGVVLLMDIRHPMKELDIRMLECCAERQLPAMCC